MKSIVTSMTEMPSATAGRMPYFVAKCTSTQGDANAPMFLSPGVLNVAALQSRVFNYTKTFFPGTEEQCQELRDGFEAGVTVVNIASFSWETGFKFNILGKDGELLQEIVKVTAVSNGLVKDTNGKPIPKGVQYETEDYQPKVYTKITSVLFVDDDEKSVEGDPIESCKRNWEAGLKNGTYIVIEG